MREISIQTKTFDNYKRKNLSIIEVINQEGFLARAEKKYAYYVSEQNEAKDSAQLKAWVDPKPRPTRKRPVTYRSKRRLIIRPDLGK